MDKGVKGLLTGDLSVYIIQQIQTSIEKYQSQLNEISIKIEEHLEKKEIINEFYDKNFSLMEGTANAQISKSDQESMESFMFLLQEQDWKKHVGAATKDNTQYDSAFDKYLSQDMIESKKESKIPLHFMDIKNAHGYLKNKMSEFKST